MSADFGPNAVVVERVIEAARTIDADQVEKLAAAWDAVRDAAWDAARDAAWDAAWDAARVAAWDAVWAAIACVVVDLISPEQFEMLLGPWIAVMGDPRLEVARHEHP